MISRCPLPSPFHVIGRETHDNPAHSQGKQKLRGFGGNKPEIRCPKSERTPNSGFRTPKRAGGGFGLRVSKFFRTPGFGLRTSIYSASSPSSTFQQARSMKCFQRSCRCRLKLICTNGRHFGRLGLPSPRPAAKAAPSNAPWGNPWKI